MMLWSGFVVLPLLYVEPSFLCKDDAGVELNEFLFIKAERQNENGGSKIKSGND